jgi:hypothetical protein
VILLTGTPTLLLSATAFSTFAVSLCLLSSSVPSTSLVISFISDLTDNAEADLVAHLLNGVVCSGRATTLFLLPRILQGKILLSDRRRLSIAGPCTFSITSDIAPCPLLPEKPLRNETFFSYASIYMSCSLQCRSVLTVV